MIQKKYTYFIFLFIASVLLFSAIQPALALEQTYPEINGTTIDNSSTYLDYIKYFFTFAVAIAGIIGVISIVVSGFQILAYFGSPTAISDARERIFGAVLGIALLMASFIILRTINPALVNQELSILSVEDIEPGLYYVSTPTGANTTPQFLRISVGTQARDTDDVTIVPAPFTKLFYYCTNPSATEQGQRLLVWKYNQTNFRVDRATNADDTAVDTAPIPCGGTDTDYNNPLYTVNIKSPIKSFKTAYEESGVYFYTKENCSGISSLVQRDSDRIIFPQFTSPKTANDQMLSIKIISGNAATEKFGVVLNKNTDQNGQCSDPYLNPEPGEKCITLGNIEESHPFDKPAYTYILNYTPWRGEYIIYSKGLPVRDDATGDIINYHNGSSVSIGANTGDFFGDENYYYDEGDRYYTYFEDGTKSINGLLYEKGENPEKPEACKPGPGNSSTVSQSRCLKSTATVNDGFFYAIFYAVNMTTDKETCQIFTKDIASFEEEHITQNYNLINAMHVVPRAVLPR